MIKPCRTTNSFLITIACIGLLACAGSPDKDMRPALIQSAEKSLELGVSNYEENNFVKAEAHFDRALFLYRNIDNPEGIASSCLNIAKTKLSSGRVNEARAYADQAQTIIQSEQLGEYNNRLVLIETSIAIEDNNLEDAKQKLDNLLADKSISNKFLIEIAALQNRTRVAFLMNDSEASDWVEKYTNALNRAGKNTKLNRARLLRFEAALEPDSTEEKLDKALALYRKAAHGPGIAATLYEWAAYDASRGASKNAIEKLHRALFIRTNLQDRKNSQKILQQLTSSYSQLGEANKSERASYWQEKLDNELFQEWDSISFEFDNYPR